MSISSMVNVAYLRRADVADTPPPSHKSAGAAKDEKGAASGALAASNSVSSGLSAIVAYIPTEVLTLYVAVLAAIQHPTAAVQPTQLELRPLWISFYGFLAATPLIVWLVYAAKVRAENKKLPVAPRTWPWWEMFAATVAYVAWAFALPNSPFQKYSSWYSSAIAGVVVLVISTLLGLLAPLVRRPLPS